jgi:hypothetical protein
MIDVLVAVASLAFFCSPIIGLIVGAVYFFKADYKTALWLRLLSSAFGPAQVILLVLAGFLWPDRYRYQQTGVQAYYWLQVLPLLLLGFTLAKYPGNRNLHLILVPAGILSWGGTFAIGWFLINGL